MEREVFENPEIAGYMNQHFVNIKVDREERPDLDELYMLATQMTTGSGGWPMSVWLTPQLKPFYAGTYFPPDDQHGRPGFPSVLAAIHRAWQDQRAQLMQQADHIAHTITERLNRDDSLEKAIKSAAWIAAAVTESQRRIDLTWGGFSGAPKFPPHQTLLFWMALLQAQHQALGHENDANRHAESQPGINAAAKTLGREHGSPGNSAAGTHDINVAANIADHQSGAHGDDLADAGGIDTTAKTGVDFSAVLTDLPTAQITRWLTTTLDHMAAGGINDQIAGGFSRYSTDEQWLVPHFEKMLYDNAQLALIYARAGVLLNRSDYKNVARATLGFWLRDMTAPDGLFYSSLDADSQGVEGKFYVWNWQEILVAIPDDLDRLLACEYWDLTPGGNWEGHNIPRVIADVAQLARRHGQSSEIVQTRLHKIQKQLLTLRSRRIAPHCDDKILTSWNGLMIQALAEAAMLLHEPRYYAAAATAATALLRVHQDADGQLLHVSRAGRADIPSFLDDYACCGIGVWTLARAARQFEPAAADYWLRSAKRMAAIIVCDFYEPQTGRFFVSSRRHDQLFVRVPSGSDNAVPSAAGIAMELLLKAEIAAVDKNYQNIAWRGMTALAPHIEHYPLAFSTVLSAIMGHEEILSTPAVQ